MVSGPCVSLGVLPRLATEASAGQAPRPKWSPGLAKAPALCSVDSFSLRLPGPGPGDPGHRLSMRATQGPWRRAPLVCAQVCQLLAVSPGKQPPSLSPGLLPGCCEDIRLKASTAAPPAHPHARNLLLGGEPCKGWGHLPVVMVHVSGHPVFGLMSGGLGRSPPGPCPS